MKSFLIGIGAAGNKAVAQAVAEGTVTLEDTLIVNSTDKDFPEEYQGQKITLSPHNTGCGKERDIAKDYALSAIQSGKFNLDCINKYHSVIICTSVEGGTGSGSTPIIAKFFNEVFKKNVHVIAFTGFEEDVRGLGNTVEFFQEMNNKLIVHTISNKSFSRQAGGNKFKAEELANAEMGRRIRILVGKDLISSKQNIDDTDLLKVSNTTGYMNIEQRYLDKPLVDQDDFNRVVKKMIYESHSIKSDTPTAVRLGVILNIDPASEDAVDYAFKDIKAAYGNPYECFMHEQWDGNKEYIAFIASGMKMPLKEIKEVYERYKEESERVNKNSDDFFADIQGLKLNEEDKKFDMVKPAQQGTSVNDFLSQFKTV